MKYLRRPYKRGKRPLDEPAVPPVKRAPKPVMPQKMLSVHGQPTGEDEASNARNLKMLQALAKQVKFSI